MITALFLLLAALGAPAQASTVESDVRVCGTSTPYSRYGELAFAMWGNSSNGVSAQFFRLRGYLNLSSDPTAPEKPKAEVIADFLSAVQIRGISLCVRGNLESAERAGKALYWLSPKSFHVLEKNNEILLPSEVAAPYALKLGPMPVFTLKTLEGENFSRQYFFDLLPTLLKSQLALPCAELDMAASGHAELLAFSLTRQDKATLTGDATLHCSDEMNDLLHVRIELKRAGPGTISGTITAVRGVSSNPVVIEIHR